MARPGTFPFTDPRFSFSQSATRGLHLDSDSTPDVRSTHHHDFISAWGGSRRC